MNDLFQKALSFGIGITVASKEKIEQAVDELVKKGQLAPSESKEMVDRLIEKGEEQKEDIKRLVRENMQKLFTELHVATKEDIGRLERRLEQLEAVHTQSD
ncbi:polyhydroxyalkanoate synthesis regulator [Paenibacillus mesophilus]|uniref:phasin family protein n=1 Tax=Paenibacillus mesophilus TaxID=2582849 RepID=UPI00110E4EAB|nr:polyhydroxyalkanoate synthesis regulator [Paenibacillus mesophilus]TMV50188.1 polyhydroxyalkanoate synthesis regulator [Paenibacillus mesophilus]